MHKTSSLVAALSLSLVALAGCDDNKPGGAPAGGSAAPKGAETAAKPTAAAKAGATAAATAAATGAAGAAAQTDSSKYPMTGFTPVAPTCAEAHVLLATAPAGSSPEWAFTTQTLEAHQEFKLGATGPMAVDFSIAEYGEPGPTGAPIALIANCDGATCNRLAATYKTVVRSSHPQVFCGKIPGAKIKEAFSIPLDRALPTKDSSPIQKCARIGICEIALDQSIPGDPALECQKAPAKFKLECASKPTCAEVVACAK